MPGFRGQATIERNGKEICRCSSEADGAWTPTGPGAPTITGASLGPDPTQWTPFWEFGKDSILAVRAAVQEAGTARHGDAWFLGAGRTRDTQRPNAQQIRDEILPVLHRILESDPQRDLRSACLVAIAKIGVDLDGHPLIPALRVHLTSHDQEIRETAALAMGISQRPAAIPDLAALALDTDRGRELCGRETVDERTRAFATYGLGLVAWASRSAAVKRIALQVLDTLLAQRVRASQLLPIAALDAIGLAGVLDIF